MCPHEAGHALAAQWLRPCSGGNSGGSGGHSSDSGGLNQVTESETECNTLLTL